MGVTSTMRGYGRAARFKAEAMSHQAKDRMLEKRLERANQETERLRSENEMLRDEVTESHHEHQRILEMLEDRLPEEDDGRSHRGRWLLFLLALGGGIYAFVRQMRPDREAWRDEDVSTGSSIAPA